MSNNTKGKKNRNNFLSSPHLLQTANHLTYLIQTAYAVLLKTSDFNLVRHYVKQIRVLCQKKQIRLHPEMKRLLCSYCQMILLAPLTANVSLDEKKSIRLTCLTCHRSRNYPKGKMGKIDSQLRILKFKPPKLVPRFILAPNYRLNQFQYRQALPARLRDYVRGGGSATSEYNCGPLMNVMLTCLQKNEYDNFHCEKEVSDFYACVKEFQETVTVEKANFKGGSDPDKVVKQFAKNRQPAWLSNRLLKSYPTSATVE